MKNRLSHFETKGLLKYILAILVTLIATLPLYFLRPYLNNTTIALIYLLPIILVTTLWGLWPGLLSGVFAFLFYNYFFLQPYQTLVVHHAQDITALVIFFIVSVIINQLVGRSKKSLTEAVTRERESARLYELSQSLAGVYKPEEITSILADHTSETFLAECVEVQFENHTSSSSQGERRFLAHEPAPHSPSEGLPAKLFPTMIIPMQTARSVLGEIRIYRSSEPLSTSEERLLRTFANQGALALERSMLLQTETRAQVLEESDRLKSALLSSVSHELRTPLATIKASATSLLSGEMNWSSDETADENNHKEDLISEPVKELLVTIDEEVDHLNRLVGNLLDMSRIEAGALQPNRQWNILSEIVDAAIQLTRRVVEDYYLEINIPDDLPLIPVDFMQIERVFVNLISNSAKYAPPGSAIQVSTRVPDSQFILVQVTNQGPPVPQEHLERIFDKFYRVTDAERVTGTGLGLSICKGIIEAHGGRIWAENFPGRFAFKFVLPITWEGKSPAAVTSEIL